MKIKKENNNIIDYKESYNQISLEETFLLRYSDPVNSISLTDNYLLFGSMIGKTILYNISQKHFYQLYDITNENIMGTSLENEINNKIVHYIAIGDESVVSFFEKENERDIEANTIYNYEKKDTHKLNCPNNFTLLWKNKVLIINLYTPNNYNEEIGLKKNTYILLTYDIEDKLKDLKEEGQIEMSNYSVPFDFMDNKFLFLEHNPNEKRIICIYEFQNDETKDKKKVLITIDKNFGHISFMKFLDKNIILMVRNYNIIEIYDIEGDPKIISSYQNNYEINDINFFEIKNNDEKENENIISSKVKIRQYNFIFFDVEQNIIEFKFKNENNIDILFSINIKDIEGINANLKDRGLFDLDFPYYIRNSPHYIALTTDQACFLFKKEK